MFTQMKIDLKKWLYYFYCALFFGRLKPLGRFCLCAPYVIVKQNSFKSRSFSKNIMSKTFKNSDWLVLIAGGHFLLLVYLKDSQSTLSFTGVYVAIALLGPFG